MNTVPMYFNYKDFTKINLPMMVYCFELTEEAKLVCVIITPY